MNDQLSSNLVIGFGFVVKMPNNNNVLGRNRKKQFFIFGVQKI